ncbi:HBS1-like protein [Forsythia ovata]|uniref:HBS1-like protein n=1 Tax=Forsythia ovata TaxID=205694 RepID=A0ABD1R7S2_9LAMI
MPRKVNYGVDYDEDYNVYEDYDYPYGDEYEYENEEREIAPRTKEKKEVIKTGVWRCPICTYDNEDSMSECEICGVLRNPLVKFSGNGDSAAVGGRWKNSGASVMAKSLFASVPHRTSAKFVPIEAQNDVSLTEDGFNFHKLGNIRGNLHEFHTAFSSPNHQNINIGQNKI